MLEEFDDRGGDEQVFVLNRKSFRSLSTPLQRKLRRGFDSHQVRTTPPLAKKSINIKMIN